MLNNQGALAVLFKNHFMSFENSQHTATTDIQQYCPENFKVKSELLSKSIYQYLPPDASALSDDEKISRIARHIQGILSTLGLDLTDKSLRDTPQRVAKMYVKETFKGLNELNKPAISTFDNEYGYKEMLIEKNITLYSTCEHHLVPIIGKAHVAYFPKSHVIGLSKLNRLVDFYARKPQVQERLTVEIAQSLQELLQTEDVAVIIEADHLCVASRGIRDTSSSTISSEFRGRFINRDVRNELMQSLRS